MLVCTLALSVALPLLAAADEERIEGIVRDTVVTHCDATRRGGCAGTLTLERRRDGKAETLTIKVPLGTPISRGDDRALLHTLEGKTVIVTRITERGEHVARAVRVAEPPRASPAAGSSAYDVC